MAKKIIFVQHKHKHSLYIEHCTVLQCFLEKWEPVKFKLL